MGVMSATDAFGFAKPEIRATLKGWKVRCAIRLPGNDNLERNFTDLLTRPVESHHRDALPHAGLP
jgi:hypothetical protein